MIMNLLIKHHVAGFLLVFFACFVNLQSFRGWSPPSNRPGWADDSYRGKGCCGGESLAAAKRVFLSLHDGP